MTNYISFAGYDSAIDAYERQPQEFRDRWSKDTLQIIGKDILVPAHGIYWLIMLQAIGFPDDQMPQLLVHGWWNLGGAKMSKSAGNIVDPFVLADKYGSDALRYYLMSDIVVGRDADFSEEGLIVRFNSDLANDFGNLLNRVLNMTQRYLHGEVRRKKLDAQVDEFFRQEVGAWISNTKYLVDLFAIDQATRWLGEAAGFCNIYIETEAPWKLSKENSARLEAVLFNLLDALRIIAILISPVLPKAAHGIFDQLNWKTEPELSGKEARFSLADAEWGRLPDGHVVGKPVPLFPRIEL